MPLKWRMERAASSEKEHSLLDYLKSKEGAIILSIFSEVKEYLTARQVAEYYGLQVKRNGLACCPFHDDKHPSMKIDTNYHCFACGVGGDAVDYASRMFGLSQYEIPVNEDFLKNSNVGLQLQGLFDIILLQTSKNEIEGLREVIQDRLGLKFNFRTQEENFEYFNEYYFSSLKTIAVLTAILVLILTCLTIWNSLASIRMMIKDFTINLFVGLSYSKLRKIFYGYYGILFFTNLIVLFIITAYSRYGTWIRKDASFSTFGLFGIIGMDWLALGVVLFFNIIIGIIVVEIMLWRIKRVPISLGVLQ